MQIPDFAGEGDDGGGGGGEGDGGDGGGGGVLVRLYTMISISM